jgi:hypothetical protein
VFVAAILVAGCADDRDEYYGDDSIESGQLLTDPYRNTYPTVPGQTTGAGMPVDKRTGGDITGRDVTPREQLEAGQNVPGDQTPGAVRPVDPDPVVNEPIDAPQR